MSDLKRGEYLHRCSTGFDFKAHFKKCYRKLTWKILIFYSVFYFVFWSFYLHILSRVAHHPLVAPLVRFNLSLLVWTRVLYHKKVK